MSDYAPLGSNEAGDVRRTDSSRRPGSSDGDVWVWRRKGVFEKLNAETKWIG